MSLALLLALQAAPPAPAEPQARAGPLPIAFALATAKPADPCGAAPSEASDIVVCGRRPGVYDFEKWERMFEAGPLVAETSLGGGAVARAYVESVEMPNGQVSKRAMVGVKIKF
jgi:hypothetical protein